MIGPFHLGNSIGKPVAGHICYGDISTKLNLFAKAKLLRGIIFADDQCIAIGNNIRVQRLGDMLSLLLTGNAVNIDRVGSIGIDLMAADQQALGVDAIRGAGQHGQHPP